MAEEDSGQEKTEDPTPKRLREAREKGDIPRSRELITMAILLAAVASAMLFGRQLVERMIGVIEFNFGLERAGAFDESLMFAHLGHSFGDALIGLIGFFAALVLVALIAPISLGGWNFSAQAMAPKSSRLNPLSGLKRMFSLNALVELLKALAKFGLVGSVAVAILWFVRADLLALSEGNVRGAIGQAVELVMWVFMVLSATLILIAAVDVPFQLYQYNKKLKMTLQEIKDEMKNTEGKPEVKGRIRQLQREIAQRQMMTAVPEADVVITNPTHYAVALKYDGSRGEAPVMVAKGADFVALKIREIAAEHDVPILSAPPLARAIYHSTEINQEIPAGLYMAVAQVLAHVYQLKRYRARQAEKPQPLREQDMEIPAELRVDE